MTEGYWKFLFLPLNSWLFGVVVMTPDWESVGCKFKDSKGIFSFLKEKPSLISLILNILLSWNPVHKVLLSNNTLIWLLICLWYYGTKHNTVV